MPGALTQLHVVYAVLLRETKTRFGSHQLGYLWAIVHPLLWIGMFAVLYRALGRGLPPGMSLIAFLATGIIPFSLFRETAGRCMSAIDANRGLLFYPLVRPLDLVIARLVLEFVTQLVVLAVLLGITAVLDESMRVNDVLETLLALVLAAGLGASLGLVSCSLSVYSRVVEQLFPALLRPLFWLSAVFHPVASVPNSAREILLLNPVTHVVEMTRNGWFPGYNARHVDPWYVATWIVVLAFVGLTLERTARRHLELS